MAKAQQLGLITRLWVLINVMIVLLLLLVQHSTEAIRIKNREKDTTISKASTRRLPLRHRYHHHHHHHYQGSPFTLHQSNTTRVTILSPEAIQGSFARAEALISKSNRNGSELADEHHGIIRRRRRRRPGKEANTGNILMEYDYNGLGQDYVSPVASGGGDYLTEIQLGVPPTPQIVLLDTGSDLVWVQCQPCLLCFPQQGDIFNPGTSSSFEALQCGSSPCEDLDYYACGYYDSACVYGYAYGDGSETIGDLALDNLTLFSGRSDDEVTFEGFVFGCGHENEATFGGEGPAGVLGMGRGPLSLVEQLDGYISSRFAYCLVPYYSLEESVLMLGYEENMTSSVAFTPILTYGPSPTYYYIQITGISVDGRRLSIPASTFELTREGGGSIFDSGTTLTYLPPIAHNRVVEAFSSYIATPTTPSPIQGLDLCYDVGTSQRVDFPSFVFHFGGGVDMEVPSENYMVEVEEGIVCLIVVNSGVDFAILGNLQQQNFAMYYDLENSRIGFSRADCSSF